MRHERRGGGGARADIGVVSGRRGTGGAGPRDIRRRARAGDGTKIVLTGDPYQIDHPYVDSVSNGLTYLVEHFKGLPIAATVTLRKGERSELAELASNVL